jgi:transcriptional regulator with XRE-family HTH domain
MLIRVKVNIVVVEKEIARRNLSHNMLAIKAGISSSYISQIISGTRYPSPQIREKLQKALQPLTFDDIFIIEEIDQNGSKVDKPLEGAKETKG